MTTHSFVRRFANCSPARKTLTYAEKPKMGGKQSKWLNCFPDLIVTDLAMPVMNGLEGTRVLKKLMPAVPVIIFTAHSDPFVEKEARAAGASAVVSKSEAVAALI